jgi:hypothetical protein
MGNDGAINGVASILLPWTCEAVFSGLFLFTPRAHVAPRLERPQRARTCHHTHSRDRLGHAAEASDLRRDRCVEWLRLASPSRPSTRNDAGLSTFKYISRWRVFRLVSPGRFHAISRADPRHRATAVAESGTDPLSLCAQLSAITGSGFGLFGPFPRRVDSRSIAAGCVRVIGLHPGIGRTRAQAFGARMRARRRRSLPARLPRWPLAAGSGRPRNRRNGGS